MKEPLNIKGCYTITSINDLSGEIIKTEKFNVITQLFVDNLFKLLNYDIDTPAADSLNLDYMALGTGTNSAMRSDTTLQTEYFRKTASQKAYTDTQFLFRSVIGATEGNPTGNIREIGIFSGGSATADTGTLISRANVDIIKNSNIQLVIDWKLTV